MLKITDKNKIDTVKNIVEGLKNPKHKVDRDFYLFNFHGLFLCYGKDLLELDGSFGGFRVHATVKINKTFFGFIKSLDVYLFEDCSKELFNTFVGYTNCTYFETLLNNVCVCLLVKNTMT